MEAQELVNHTMSVSCYNFRSIRHCVIHYQALDCSKSETYTTRKDEVNISLQGQSTLG